MPYSALRHTRATHPPTLEKWYIVGRFTSESDKELAMRIGHLRNDLSKVTVQIHMCFQSADGKIDLACGSGMLRSEDDTLFLITNWHNMTGCRNDNHEVISKTGGVPNLVRIRIGISTKHANEPDVLRWVEHEEPLYQDGKPRWFEHPELAHDVDVAALPINVDEVIRNNLFHMLQDKLPDDNVIPEPGMDCFIIGFPLGISGGLGLPIWKRASIASEPDFDIDKLPKLLVDSATRAGLSGSPVFIMLNGFVTADGRIGADGSGTSSMGVHRRFLGIYSGRIGDDHLGAQLGVVWKSHCIDEIIQGRKAGTHPYPPELTALS